MPKGKEAVVENVLCVPREILDDLEVPQGVVQGEQGKSLLNQILTEDNLVWEKRDKAEKDTSLKQVIPYAFITLTNRVWVYKRGRAGQEGRLHDLLSLGVGGHVHPEDGAAGWAAVEGALAREISEEVCLSGKNTQRVVGLINDESNDVGKVHLGVLYRIDLDREDWRISPKENSLVDAHWQFHTVAYNKRADYEHWSQLVLSSLLCPHVS